MPHSSRVRVFLASGHYSFASRQQCINLASAQKGYWRGADFVMYQQVAQGTGGEWRTRDSQEGRRVPEGPKIPVRQFFRR